MPNFDTKRVLVTFGALLVSAQATAGLFSFDPEDNDNPYLEADTARSTALNLALATGLTRKETGPLTDLPRADLPQDLRNAPSSTFQNSSNLTTHLAMSGLNFAKMGNAIQGLSFNLRGGADMAMALFAPKQLPHPATTVQTLAWMPGSQAENKKQAKEQMESIVREAVLRTMVEDYGWTTYEQEVDIGGTLTGPKLVMRTFFKGGGQCGITVHCYVGANVSSPHKSAGTPDLIGPAGPAWSWRNWLWRDKSTKRRRLAGFVDVRTLEFGIPEEAVDIGLSDWRGFLFNLSKHYPDWVVVYYPPSQEANYPALFRQGQELLFVEPLPDEVQTRSVLR